MKEAERVALRHSLKAGRTNKHKQWTLDEAREVFLRCDSISEVIAEAGNGCYRYVQRNGCLNEFCRHMSKKPDSYEWTDEELIEFARGHKTHSSLKSKSAVVYGHLEDRGLLGKALPPKSTQWTLEACKEIALKYTRRSDWQKHDRNSSAAAERNGWMEECCGHMDPVPERIKKRVKAGTWTRDMCYESAKRFNSSTEWERGDGKAYYAAVNKGWLKEIGALLGWVSFKPPGYWEDPLNCLTEARKYQSRSEWYEKSRGSYNGAHKYGYVEICTWHMESKVRQDEDSLYVWRVLSAKDEVVMPLPGFHLCKVGITSQHQSGTRIKNCAKANDMEHEVIAHCDVSWQDGNDRGDAKVFESALLSMGTDPDLPYWYDGYTEFRIISDAELHLVKTLMGVEEAQAEAA